MHRHFATEWTAQGTRSSSEGMSPTFWTREIALLGLAGTHEPLGSNRGGSLLTAHSAVARPLKWTWTHESGLDLRVPGPASPN